MTAPTYMRMLMSKNVHSNVPLPWLGLEDETWKSQHSLTYTLNLHKLAPKKAPKETEDCGLQRFIRLRNPIASTDEALKPALTTDT